MRKNVIITLLVALLISWSGYAQLPDFSLNVTGTAQTCLGNGSLSISVAGTDPDANMDYAIYLLPNTTTPLVITTSTNVPGLVAGEYLVVATQSLDGESNSESFNVTIGDDVIPLEYTFTLTPERCGNDGVITVNVTSGNAVSYEIMVGPDIVAPQASNVLSGLSAGLYQVRVYDDCGEAVVVTTTLTESHTAIIWGSNSLADGELPSCNTVMTLNSFTVPSGNILFTPFSAVYTVYPPGGGAPVVLNYDPVTITPAGFLSSIPYYPGQQYSYDLVVTDDCGNEFEVENNIVNGSMVMEMIATLDSCEDGYFMIVPGRYLGPYTVEFDSAPAGFDPADFSTDHPTFSTENAQYGFAGNYVPFGEYVVTVTDACGQSATTAFTMEPIELEPNVTATVESCSNEGTITIEIPGRVIDVAILLEAPDNYPEPLQQDVIGYVAGSMLTMIDMPVGEYVFEITDACGIVYEVPVLLEATSDLDPVVAQRAGCQDGEGSVRIANLDGSGIETITMIAAPDTFTETLPYDVNFNLAGNAVFYMNSLPEGEYVFHIMDGCGQTVETEVNIIGYEYIINEMDIVPHCGAFDISINHQSTGDYTASYWLQRYNEAEGVWEHPISGNNYTEGTNITIATGYNLPNNAMVPTIAAIGHFRIIKMFLVFTNGSSANFRCYDVIQEFDFDGGPVIIDANSFPCANGLMEVAVIAEGVAPLSYSITTKDGDPFEVDNGTSNLFSGLEAATYNFQVSDVCGNIRNILLDIEALDPLAIEATGFCEGEDSSLSVEEFSFLNYEWYEESAPGTILSTTGTLNFPAYNSAADSGTYVVSITTDNENSCINQLLEYDVQPNALPNAGGDITDTLCNDGAPTDLETLLGTPHDDGGVWQDVSGTGALTGSVLAIEGLAAGTYEFTYTVTDDCDLVDEATLTIELKDIPPAPTAAEVEPVCEGETVQLSAEGVAGASYEWEGPDDFTSTEQNPVIENATAGASGAYTVRVTLNGCESEPAEVDVLVNPAPNAGGDETFAFCNDGVVIDLDDILTTPHDQGGTWQDISGSGALNGSMLDIEGLPEGLYEFSYSVEVPCGLVDDAIITIELKDIPAPPSVDEVAPVCEGENIQLAASLVPDAAYQWTGPDNYTSTEQNPVLTGVGIANMGTYIVTVTVNGCTSVGSEVPVTVTVIPQFALAGNTVLCQGQSSVLTVVPANFDENSVTYEWYLEGVLQDGFETAEAEITEPGVYSVIIDNSGCAGTNEITVTPNDNPFVVEADAGCVNFDYMIWVANMDDLGDVDVVWTGPDNFVAYEPSVDISGGATGEYFVTVTNAEGCPVTASVLVENTECTIPRGISPNGDGDNDSFDLSNLDVREIIIFNRYGLEVYRAQGYIDEWHGQSDKGELPSATYFYVITLSAGKRVTGWVYLQREI